MLAGSILHMASLMSTIPAAASDSPASILELCKMGTASVTNSGTDDFNSMPPKFRRTVRCNKRYHAPQEALNGGAAAHASSPALLACTQTRPREWRGFVFRSAAQSLNLLRLTVLEPSATAYSCPLCRFVITSSTRQLQAMLFRSTTMRRRIESETATLILYWCSYGTQSRWVCHSPYRRAVGAFYRVLTCPSCKQVQPLRCSQATEAPAARACRFLADTRLAVLFPRLPEVMQRRMGVVCVLCGHPLLELRMHKASGADHQPACLPICRICTLHCHVRTELPLADGLLRAHRACAKLLKLNNTEDRHHPLQTSRLTRAVNSCTGLACWKWSARGTAAASGVDSQNPYTAANRSGPLLRSGAAPAADSGWPSWRLRSAAQSSSQPKCRRFQRWTGRCLQQCSATVANAFRDRRSCSSSTPATACSGSRVGGPRQKYYRAREGCRSKGLIF